MNEKGIAVVVYIIVAAVVMYVVVKSCVPMVKDFSQAMDEVAVNYEADAEKAALPPRDIYVTTDVIYDYRGNVTSSVPKYIRLGMSESEVRKILGEPEDINCTTGSYGVHEQWVYEDKDMYLYFEDGILTTVQD